MLREHDLFEVVLNPGADKREKLVLGQITRPAGDTGRIMLGGGRCPDSCQSAAQHLQSIGTLLKSQSLLPFIQAPHPTKGQSRRNPHLRNSNDDRLSRQVRQGETDLAPAPTPKTVPPSKKSGTSDPTSAPSSSLSLSGKGHAQLPLEPQQRGSRIRRARAHASLDR